jgi:hypothetical protein
MSAPGLLDNVVCSKFELPRVTPPATPVVQNVIGPPEVANCLGNATLSPLLEVMRPVDFTRIPPLPAVMLAFRAVVPETLEISTTPRDVMGAALVIVDALEILTVAALIAPVPVSTVEDAPVLEIVTLWLAVIVAEFVVV